jgi:hypothetical protein
MAMYATAAGFPNPGQMAEVGFAESGGDPNVVNSIGAVGVLQILQPVHVKSHPSWTVAWLKNPLNNFMAGKVLYDADKKAGGNGLRPWEDSRLKGNGGGWGSKGSVEQAGLNPGDLLGDFLGGFADGATGAIPDVPGVGGLSDIASLTTKFATWATNPRSWLSAGYVLIGGVIIIVALSATVRQLVISQAASTVNKVIKK